jgi:tetratricopeptide (TPR) repeat protein
MEKIIYILIVFLYFISIPCWAEWMSDTDKKYQQKNSTLYSKVSQAKALIDDKEGNTNNQYDALDILNSVIKEDTKFAPAYIQFARAASNLGYTKNNQFENTSMLSMEQYLEKALKIEPKYDYAIALMGYSKMFQGDLVAAEQYYKSAMALKSKYPHLKSQLAELSIKQGDYKKALELAEQAYQENISEPKDAAGAITEIIFAYQKIPGDHPVELEKWYAKRAELTPNSAWNIDAYASFKLYYLGDYEKAIELGNKALNIMNFGVGRRNLAAAYYTKWAHLKDSAITSVSANDAFKHAMELYPFSNEMIQEFLPNPNLKLTGEALLKLNR